MGGNEPFQIITDTLPNFHTYLRKYIKFLQHLFSNILHIGLIFVFLCGIDGETLKTGGMWDIIKCKVQSAECKVSEGLCPCPIKMMINFSINFKKNIDIYVG